MGIFVIKRKWIISLVLLVQVGCQAIKKERPVCGAGEAVTYVSRDGKIEIKPRLKYELILSMHVLETAEDHHRLFVSWAEQMREDLSTTTLDDAQFLAQNVHEWQLCSLVADYDGPDTIECLADYIENENRDTINRWAGWLQSKPKFLFKDFAKWYADFLRRYYREGFEKGWRNEHKELVYNDAEILAKEVDKLDYSITEFMERHTGRRFSEGSKTIFYPSSFSRPIHAYGFSENGTMVSVCKINGGLSGVIGDAFHELLHPLLRGWQDAGRMKGPIAKLGRESAFMRFKKKGGYRYPEGWVEEHIVHAMGNYLYHKAGFASEELIRKHQVSYGGYEAALYDAIFDAYERFDTIDDFIYYALTHIEATGDEDKPFVYVGQ